jgi:hypothetical protein
MAYFIHERFGAQARDRESACQGKARAGGFPGEPPAGLRLALRNLIVEFGDDPMSCSKATEYDRDGRLMDLAIRSEYALVYWIDGADRHVKVMEIRAADK